LVDDGIAAENDNSSSSSSLKSTTPKSHLAFYSGSAVFAAVCSGDDRIVLETPEPFLSVSRFYANFLKLKLGQLVSLEEQNRMVRVSKLKNLSSLRIFQVQVLEPEVMDSWEEAVGV